MADRRILDAELEKEIKELIDREVKATVEVMNKTKKEMAEKADESADLIREKPFMWVGGAFVAGLLLGKLLSRK